MIEIRVCRGGAVFTPPKCLDNDPALHWGDEITDPLLCTEDAALERGRVEIDRDYSNRIATSVKMSDNQWTQPGTITGITDGSDTDVGILRDIELHYARTTETLLQQSNLNIEMLL